MNRFLLRNHGSHFHSLRNRPSAVVDLHQVHLLSRRRVDLLELLQHVHLELGGLAVLVHVLDDLQRQHLIPEVERKNRIDDRLRNVYIFLSTVTLQKSDFFPKKH